MNEFDEQQYRKSKMLEALDSLNRKRIEEKRKSFIQNRYKDTSQNLAKGALDKDVLIVKGDSNYDLTPKTTKIGTTEHYNTKEPQRLISGQEFAKKQKDIELASNLRATYLDALDRGDKGTLQKLETIAKKLGKPLTKGLKALPIVGGIASALTSQDASAAVPILGSSDELGPKSGSLEAKLESGTITPEEMEQLKKQSLMNISSKFK